MKSRTIIATLTLLSMSAAFAGSRMDADTNDDGLITLDEFKAMHEARVEERFARLDADADGYISEEEMQEARRRAHDRHGRRGSHRERNPERVFERLDVDGSGGVSLQELEGKRFAPDSDAFFAADLDGSGELDIEELIAMKKAHRPERRAYDRGSDE